MPRTVNTSRPTRPEVCFAGFDLSLTASGIIVLNSKGEVKERHVIKSKLKGQERLEEILNRIKAIIEPYNIQLVCVEGYAMGGMGRVFDIAELGGIVKFHLYQSKQTFLTPTPTQVKKYATGKGGGPNAGKDQVTMHVFKNWYFEAVDNNEADSYVLARISLALSGFDTALKAYQKEVIDQIQNPPVKKGKKNETT